MSLFSWLGDKISQGASYIGDKINQGVKWVGEKVPIVKNIADTIANNYQPISKALSYIPVIGQGLSAGADAIGAGASYVSKTLGSSKVNNALEKASSVAKNVKNIGSAFGRR
jgi:hypothetical protein